MKDDRIATRFEIAATVFVEAGERAAPPDTGKIVVCRSEDLSESGMQIVLDQPIEEGRIVRVCLDLIDREPIFVFAKVIWQESADVFHHGLVLLDQPEAEIEAWKSAIIKLASQSRVVGLN